MSLKDRLLSFLKKKEAAEKIETPEGFCPNCWGKQEYAGEFYEAVKNHNVDINSKNPNIGWVQEYADKHLSSIQLKHEDGTDVCQKCKLTYRPS